MSEFKTQAVRLREDPEYFRAAVRFTSQVTTFSPRLVEKDYSSTVLLEYLSVATDGIVFKGGTCLAKVHAHFYRLSEDLDFVIPMPADAPRARRSKRAAAIKVAVARLPDQLPFFRVIAPLTGANNSMHYNAVLGYTSLTGGREETIKIELGLREPLLMPPHAGTAQTILLDPVSGGSLIEPLILPCIAKMEAFAEKFRAALSRRELAVRDFFDLDYAVRKLGIDPEDAGLIKMVREKLAIPGNEAVDVSDARLTALLRQVEPQLRPVLRAADFAEFDVDRAFRIVRKMATFVVRTA
jgi:hypothetical protein